MYLGIDIGTSAVKAVAMSDEGLVVAQGNVPISVHRPSLLMSEQHPDDWWQATQTAIREIPSSVRAEVQAVGIAGQMHGATLLGMDDKPLRPAILWNDGRSFAECEEIEAAVPEARSITGNIPMPGFTAPKLMWVRKHEPEVFEKIRTVLLPKDFVRLCMTGEKASDMSDSAGTLWMDTGKRCWSEIMLDSCGLTRDHMPSLFEGPEITGLLQKEIAAEWGMGRVPVIAGGSDNAAGAAGIGIINEGDAMLSLGTSGVIFVATRAFRPNPERAVHAFCHCLPGMWHQMSVHLSAASCVDWTVRQLGLAGPADFFELATQAQSDPGPEIFLPYLSGERTPHNDPHVRGAFLGLNSETTPGRLCAAVLEGVAFAVADGLDALREAKTNVQALSMIGGGARSRFWGEILSSVLNVRLKYLEGGEVGPALGAAKLARLAVTGTTAEDVCTTPRVLQIIEPDPKRSERLAPKRAEFRRAYPAICNLQERELDDSRLLRRI